jgi:hypothetical protein
VPLRLSSHRLPFSLSIGGGTTYEKTGGATADWEAGGALSRQRRRKRAIVLPLVQPIAPSLFEKAGGGRAVCEARGRKEVEKERAGGAGVQARASGTKLRALHGRTGAAEGLVAASGARIRILAPRSGGAVLTADTGALRLAVYAEMGVGRARLDAGGRMRVLRGDDSEELLLLGLEPEDEELLLLA